MFPANNSLDMLGKEKGVWWGAEGSKPNGQDILEHFIYFRLYSCHVFFPTVSLTSLWSLQHSLANTIIIEELLNIVWKH